jgi:hypothetical protein
MLLLLLGGNVELNPGPPKLRKQADKQNSDYFNDEQFECFNLKGLHFIHLNARSLLPKIPELRIIANKSKASVIAISETWIDNSVTDSEISIENYCVLRQDRNRSGGGVCVYVRSNLAFARRTDIVNDNIESLWLELYLPKTKPIIVGVCYRPPTHASFIDHWEEELSKLRMDCETIILGDFNICTAKKTNPLYKPYMNILNLFSFHQVIVDPTRVTCDTESIIDHILCNFKENIVNSGVITTGISDHFMTFCTRKISRGHFKSHNIIKIRSLKNYSVESLQFLLASVDWSSCINADCVNVAWLIFKQIFTSILDSLAPVVEIRVKQRTEPWMTSYIFSLIRDRDRHLYLYRKHKNTEDHKVFCKLRNLVQREVKKARSSYFQDKIEENRSEPKKLWQQLKNLGYKYKQSSSENIVLNIGGTVQHKGKIIADYFNSFFTTIASKLVDKLPSPSHMFSVTSNVFRQFYKDKNTEHKTLLLQSVSEDFIYKELRALNVNKSTGLDDIPARFLKDGAFYIKEPIMAIVNTSITTGTVPDDFKMARVKPLFKKGNSLDVGNYRPVSILCIVSKILEKCVHVQLLKFLNDNHLLYSYQSGFRNKFSTDTCLIHMLDFIRSNNSKGLFTGMVMLDLQKAFDTVDHTILCDKLSVLGVLSTEWFKSYLSCRQQQVYVNNISSDFNSINCGVPQGSILGPLLFLIYVNDMSVSVDDDCKLILYADDSAIFYAHRDPNVISQKLGSVLEKCSSWLVDNRLSLHLGKTESMLFGPPRKLKNVTDFKIVCNGLVIKGVDSVKYLGICIDKFLTCENIVLSIIQKVNARLKFLYRNATCLNTQTRKTLCSALIQCYFDYACSSWYCGINKQLKHKLQVTQNKIVRFILNLGPRESISCNVLDSLNMLNVEDRATQLRLNHVYNIYHGKAPSYLCDHFVLNNNITRSATNKHFHIPKIRGKESSNFYYNAIKDWNALPLKIKEVDSKQTFKKAVKSFLATNARNTL